MVVVSGTWVKYVPKFSSPLADDKVISNKSKMSAKAVLICRPNSHPFQERTLQLEQPIKVGRSVARARATATNAIFDCKVLSRHHALIWYENGKFYLQDTKSSNGTFINNNRLTAETEHHEVSSGDIVQFGVDVIENNRKVTHGCIIATLKLYLPDGTEAKASPSITENNSHVVPLDELYKLHQIIQEATQREQCLETKLTALQTVVYEAKKSAEESWQAYVGEERLLSRVSALETQLHQTGKNWSEDKCREEISKLQDDSAAYQVAAKEALEKVHAERLEAQALATEQERCRISAEQEIMLAKEQLSQTQLELEEVARRLSEEQKKAREERINLEQQQWDLQTRLDVEIDKVERLQMKLGNSEPYNPIFSDINMESMDSHIIYNDDVKTKEDMLAENDISESDMNKVNGLEPQNHISLTVAPVSEAPNNKEDCEKPPQDPSNPDQPPKTPPPIDPKPEKHVSIQLPEQLTPHHSPKPYHPQPQDSPPESPKDSGGEESEKSDFDSDHSDSKTLKYKYQSAQNELKKKIEKLETIVASNETKMAELQTALTAEQDECVRQLGDNERLRDDLTVLQQKWKESCNESQQLKDKVECLVSEAGEKRQMSPEVCSNISVSYKQLVNLEEELVLLKERYAQINGEKLQLQHDVANLKEKYNRVCNSSYDKMYFYMAPLILMVLYLVISAMIS